MTRLIPAIVPAVSAAALSYSLTPLVGRLAVRIGAIDMPGERKIHKSPVPRLGGLAVVAAITVVLETARLLPYPAIGLPPGMLRGIALGLLPIFAISLLDDVRRVSAWVKFIAHVLGACIAVAFGISLGGSVHLFGASIHIGVLAVPISVLWIVGVTNAFNIIDGLDGLSAGLALISAASICTVFLMVNQPAMAGVALVFCGALIGFLPYNVHPARLFLGDTGATTIGFCLAAFTLKGGATLTSGFAALLPVFMLGLPIADTFIAMARRTLAGMIDHRTAVFGADRNHIHHRLLALGIDHGKAVVILYCAGLALTGAAFLSMFMTTREAALFLVALLVAGFLGLQRLHYDEFAFLRRGTMLRVYETPTVKRGMFVVFVDVFLVIVAAYVAVGLKTDRWVTANVEQVVFLLAAMFAPLTVLVFWSMGLYRGSWRFAGAQEYMRAAAAVGVVTVVGAFTTEWASPRDHPVSLFAIYGVVGLLLVLASRASHVMLLSLKLRARSEGTPVLIYGAGQRGVAAVNDMFSTEAATFRPVGFIDDDPDKMGQILNGLPVLGTARDIAAAVRSSGAEGLLISSPRISAERAREAAERCGSLAVFRLNVRVERLGQPATFVDPSVPDAAPIEVSLPAPVAVVAANPTSRGRSARCPSCASANVHRSKARTAYERLRKLQTAQRLFRCHDCDWRGWMLPLEYGMSFQIVVEPFDAAALDSMFEERLASL